VVIFDIIMVACNVSCAKNQGLAFRPTHHRASALDLLSLTGKGADSDLAEAFTCQDISMLPSKREKSSCDENVSRGRSLSRWLMEKVVTGG